MFFDVVPNEILCIIIDFIPLYKREPLLRSTSMCELLTPYKQYLNHKMRFANSLKLINTIPRFVIRLTENFPTDVIGYSAIKRNNIITLYVNCKHLCIINRAGIINSSNINNMSLYHCIKYKQSMSILYSMCLIEFEYCDTSIDKRL
jgi:hypothetical protein